MSWVRIPTDASELMAWFLFALSAGLAGLSLWWALKMKGRLTRIKQKYAPALDIDDYVSKEEAKLSKRQEEAELDLDQFRIKS